MSTRFVAVSVLFILGSFACAPSVHVTRLGGPFEPRQGVSEIHVFSTQTPECEYSEIAIVTAYQGGLFGGTLDGAMDVLKEKARHIGADAVVGVRLVAKGGEDARRGYSGTAIRFKDPSCMK